jgi:(R)-2-hydroxyacyl-CoA dehydratese activating ATPase
MYHCGFDIGSRTGKIVVIGSGDEILFSNVVPSISSAILTYEKLLFSIPGNTGKNIASTTVTGYGRESVLEKVNYSATEITCHFLGVKKENPEISTIIDIGGQDSKIITLRKNGSIKDFVMNDRCAAGTGRFVEVMCERIGFSISQFAELNVEQVETVPINSTCTVFAESEVISLLSKGVEPVKIASSLAKMAAWNTFNMSKKLHPAPPFFMSGGVSGLEPVVYHLKKLFKSDIIKSPNSQIMGAYGAALFGKNKFQNGEQ